MLTYTAQDLYLFIIAGLGILVLYYLCVIKNNLVSLAGVIAAGLFSFFPIFFGHWGSQSGYLNGFIRPALFVLLYPIFLYLFYIGQRGKKRALVALNRTVASAVEILTAAVFVTMIYVLIAIPFNIYAFTEQIRSFLLTALWWLCGVSMMVNLITGYFADVVLYLGMFGSSFTIRRYLLSGIPNSIIIDMVTKILVPFYIGLVLFLLLKYVLGKR